LKSHASDLTEMAICIYEDAVAKCVGLSLDNRDLITIRSRVEHEGLSFLTITLPELGKDFERSLSTSQLGPTLFRSFRKRGKTPAFLRGFFDLVFDETGGLHDEPSIEAVEGIRQIAHAFKKLKVPCSSIRVRKALAQFAMVEHSFERPITPSDSEYFANVSRALWSNTFPLQIDLQLDIRPKHGPGATGERLNGNAKYLNSVWHERLEPYFPLLDNAFANVNAMDSGEFQKMTLVPEDQEKPVRVIPVPKTLKTPRIIAIEPVCMQYTQQGLSRYIVDVLETSKLTRGHLNFRRQNVNQRLAMESSLSKRYSTLDLSMASDLVPYELAISMFDAIPDLRDAITACRSKTAQLPSGDILPLKKFASMGSALCFPVESMYFYTICVGALLKKRNLPVTFLNAYKVSRDVYVYGDDIIVPTDASTEVIEALQKYYCKVNTTKSFTTGNFRESCGMDAFLGENVTPTYIRETNPGNLRSPERIISWVASSNLFYKRGYWRTSDYMRKRVEAITGELPVVGEKCPGLGWVSFQPAVSIHRWGLGLSRPEVRTYVPSPVYVKDTLKGYPALLKCLLLLESKVSNLADNQLEKRHLQRSARHGAVALKRRWVLPW